MLLMTATLKSSGCTGRKGRSSPPAATRQRSTASNPSSARSRSPVISSGWTATFFSHLVSLLSCWTASLPLPTGPGSAASSVSPVRPWGRIFTAAHAETIQGGKPARIKTSSGRIVTVDAVVVATNSPINDLLAIHTKQAAYMSYAIGAIVPRGAVATALYWDTLDPYHYV